MAKRIPRPAAMPQPKLRPPKPPSPVHRALHNRLHPDQPQVVEPLMTPAPAPSPRSNARKQRTHISLQTNQLAIIQTVSNEFGYSVASLIRYAVIHWLQFRDPANPLAFRCLNAVIPQPDVSALPLTRRASAPPAGQPDRRPTTEKRPFRVSGEDTQDGKPMLIPHARMDQLASLVDKDSKAYGDDDPLDVVARRLYKKIGLTIPETMAAMGGLDAGYLDDEAKSDETDEEEEED